LREEKGSFHKGGQRERKLSQRAKGKEAFTKSKSAQRGSPHKEEAWAVGNKRMKGLLIQQVKNKSPMAAYEDSLASNPSLLRETDKGGFTPLHYAASLPNLLALKVFLAFPSLSVSFLLIPRPPIFHSSCPSFFANMINSKNRKKT